MSKVKRIFVVGHMGAGKALYSEALAKKLGWQFVDANPSLERYIGRSLTQIMGKEGETAFHNCEAEIISHYLDKENVVVLLEEAVVVGEKSRELLKPEYVVYLKVSIPQQLERMKGGRSPALPFSDINAFLEKLHQERNPFFDQVASLVIESVSVEDDVNKTVRTIGL